MSETQSMKLVDNTSNPAPLGLAAFGLTTILLNVHNANAELFPLNSAIIAMGIFYGGLAQVIVGIMEWKKNNTFGTVAFSSYGWFWISLVGIWLLPKIDPTFKTPPAFFAVYLGVWGLFSLFLFFCTFKLSRALQVVFGLLIVLFALLVMAKATGNETIEELAGYEGIICGLSALYTGMAQVVNEVYKKTILPLG
ncbi:MAG: acetate uptake transporter [Bacteroidota bacterium]